MLTFNLQLTRVGDDISFFVLVKNFHHKVMSVLNKYIISKFVLSL